MPDWIAGVRAARGREPVAIVTVLSTEGSAPRRAGTRMAVTADASFGTIGGGALEHRAIEQARRIVALPTGSWRVQDWPLGPLLGQCCGGQVRLLVEHVDPDAGWIGDVACRRPVATTIADGRLSRRPVGPDAVAPAMPAPPRSAAPGEGAAFLEPVERGVHRPLLMFGAGHVGSAIARRLPGLPFELDWFDSRREQAVPGVSLHGEDALVACAGAAPSDAAVLILTHDHALDYRLTRAALSSRARFVGLIGSATKRARFRTRLIREGVDPDRLTCPIGIPGITDKAPDAIAIATIAQLLLLESVAPVTDEKD